MIPPLVIFKGENMQTAWIPKNVNHDWSWTSNTKGWTCDAIGDNWIRHCFEPATREKANGAVRLLVADGHGSHVTAPFIRFCMDNNILVLLLPPHSSHLTQPLDVGIFSTLKKRMAEELDRILRYGVDNIKKFEWADCYRIARPVSMSSSNITNAWSGAGLIPFMPQKVLRRLRGNRSDNETVQLQALENKQSQISSSHHAFDLVPTTPSQLDPANFRAANETLANNIEAGILDTPTRTYNLKLISLSENLRARNVLIEHSYNELTVIVKKRRVMEHGKRVVLKDKVLVTTEEMYTQLKEAEDATKNKRRTSSRGRGRGRGKAAGISRKAVEDNPEQHSDTPVGVPGPVMA